ncbi:hypothetical protein KKA14_07540, partial [bacterium]|nr:hypothetical protein [bacterium]
TILQRYCAKLGKQSTKTRGMKKPVVSKIKLVGAVMKLAVTPTLNKESKDGKLQLFQVEFEDKGVKKKGSLKWIIGILLAVFLVLCVILGIAIYKKAQKKQYKPRMTRSQTYTISYCDSADNPGRFEQHLDEVNRILQMRADDLSYNGRISTEMMCDADLPKISLKEERFLACYALVSRHGMLS